MFKFILKENLEKLPSSPGVYCFQDQKGEFLYIGKASNLKNRIKNHFQNPNFGEKIWLKKSKKIGYLKTPSEIEALLWEAKLIKKYQPKFNVLWRDDKNYFYVGITKEKFPRVFITHQPKDQKTIYFGPFVDGKSLKATLRLLRKIFPYYTKKKHPKIPCPWCHLNLCPGVLPPQKEYQKNIKKLIEVLKGKREKVIKILEKEMKKAVKKQDFEKAGKIRDQIFALQKIIENARIIQEQKNEKWPLIEKELKKILETKSKIERLEGYDVSNIQGKEATGAMVTFIKTKPAKSFYRKFKIKLTKKPDDYAMIKEIISRRFKHPEWGMPDLILIDGGKGQLKAALKAKGKKIKKEIKILALAKKENKLYIEGKKDPLDLKSLLPQVQNLILNLRDEAHRFALTYHRKLRRKKFKI